MHKITWQGEAALLLVSTFPKRECPAAADESYRSVVEGAGDGILKQS